MKTSFELAVEFRDDQGKGASRRLRHDGKVPAILYGGTVAPRALALDHEKLKLMLENERFYSTILSLSVGSEKQAAILKDLQRHPYKNQIVHVDFQRVFDNEKIVLNVPLHFKGEAAAPGVKTQGGRVSHLKSELEVRCLPKDLPEFIEVDLSALNVGDIVHLSQIKLPAGVTIPALAHGKEHDLAIVIAKHARVEAEETAAPEASEVPAAKVSKPDAAPAAPNRPSNRSWDKSAFSGTRPSSAATNASTSYRPLPVKMPSPNRSW